MRPKYFIFSLAFLTALVGFCQSIQTVSREYSSQELLALFSSPDFTAVVKELQFKIENVPADNRSPISDVELSFRWGTDWIGLPQHLESQKWMKPIYSALKSPAQYDTTRYQHRPFDSTKVGLNILPGQTRIEEKDLQDQIIKNQLDRISVLSRALPGFFGWLSEASFRLPWVLVDGPITEEFCKNNHLYKIVQKVVACQTPEVIKIQKSWYEETASDLKKRTDVFIHELFRFKVILLAQAKKMEQQDQDALTARLSQAFLNPSVDPVTLYEMIKKAGLVPDDQNLDGLRQYELGLLINKKMVLLEQIIAFNAMCELRGSVKLDRYFNPQVDAVVNNLAECRRYLKPDDDEVYCEPKTLAFHILDYRKRCYK